MVARNISFQNSSFEIDPSNAVCSGLVPANPRGVVVYADNNSKWKSFGYTRQGAAQQAGRKLKRRGVVNVPGQGSLRLHEVKLLNGTTIQVAAAAELSKEAANPAYDPVTGERAGSFNWEYLRDAGGEIVAKPDSTGMFELIARKFRKLYGLSSSLICPFANVHDDLDPEGSKADSRENFFDALAAVSDTGLDFFAYAGHGGRNNLPSAQVRESDLDRLADEIARLLRPSGIVILYACNTGYPGGFASKLSERLPTMAVWGHTDSNEASINEDKVVYRNGFGIDIRDILNVPRAKYNAYMRASDDFYARFLFMTKETIEAEIGA